MVKAGRSPIGGFPEVNPSTSGYPIISDDSVVVCSMEQTRVSKDRSIGQTRQHKVWAKSRKTEVQSDQPDQQLAEISRICPPSDENLNTLKLIKTNNIPVRIAHPPENFFRILNNNIVGRERNLSNLTPISCAEILDTSTIQCVTPTTTPNEFTPSLLLSNVMSLVPKIDEIRAFTMEETFDFLFFTETWLKKSIGDNQIQLPGYKVTRRDRSTGLHGGVCLYSKESTKIKVLDQFDETDLEVLWVHTRPRRLPRGIPCIVTGTVYHPPGANNNIMTEHLANSLIEIEGQFPGCGIIIAGDFNKLNVKVLERQFQLKQLVHLHTRGNNTLDLVSHLPQP